MSWCIDCGDDFRYDDCGGYNPPCECGAHCQRCDENERNQDDSTDDGYEYCDDFDPESGSFCCLHHGHEGSHQSQRCNATCDSCNCVEWPDRSLLGKGERT